MHFIKYVSFFFVLISLFFESCSDNEELKVNEENLVGYWAITHIRTIEHIGGGHYTYDVDVLPHGNDSYAGDVDNERYDVLIFDEDYVTVRGEMPSMPKLKDFNSATTVGQIEYENALQEWYNSIGSMTDQFCCPVGKYCIKKGNLIIGSLNMGAINFISPDEFTLDYTMTIQNKGDYRRSIYTYTRIFSLKL